MRTPLSHRLRRSWDSVPDPAPTAISMASEKLRLSEEEALEAAQGKLPAHEVTPGVFLQVGLELEDTQYVCDVSY